MFIKQLTLIAFATVFMASSSMALVASTAIHATPAYAAEVKHGNNGRRPDFDRNNGRRFHHHVNNGRRPDFDKNNGRRFHHHVNNGRH